MLFIIYIFIRKIRLSSALIRLSGAEIRLSEARVTIQLSLLCTFENSSKCSYEISFDSDSFLELLKGLFRRCPKVTCWAILR